MSHRVTTLPNDMDQSIASLGWIEPAGRAWAIIPEVLVELRGLRQSIGGLRAAEIHLLEQIDVEAAARRGRPAAINGDVAVIPLKGVIMPQASLLAQLFGLGGGLNLFRAQLVDAANSEKVGAIVLDIDSPGGLVDQVPETAAVIREVARSKPVTAVANTMAASAAYWLAAQANEVVVTPSGELGSIGVYAEHRDVSKALESAGLTPTLVSAGKYKIEGNPYEPLSDAAKEAMQRTVDDYYTMFLRDVAAGRDASVSAVRSGYGEGRVLTARRAVEANLADKVATLDDVISAFQSRSRPVDNRALASSIGALAGEEAERLFAVMTGIPYTKESAA